MASDEKRIRHLDFIQLTITRMAANSFLLKAWAVTLVAALFALAAKDADANFVIVAYLPAISFWVLDAFYLAQERLYRALYDEVRAKAEVEIDFSLDASNLASYRRSWPGAFFSRTLLVFYGTIILVLIVAMCVVR